MSLLLPQKLLLFFVTFLACALFQARPAFATPPADFQTNLIIGSGLTAPSGFDIAPDGRIFILQRTGEIKIYKPGFPPDTSGQLLPQNFAVLPSVDTGDRGLIGIAFDPNFGTNHYVYFYYTGLDLLNRLVRFDASGDTGTNGPIVLYQTKTQSQQLHVGGTIQFGLDGKLYISIGDNGDTNLPQNLNSPHGKILRINADGSIPNDNPFVGQVGKLPEIWAYGLRNPFRFQFDPVSGRMYEGDVGNATWEEMNVITKGGDFGWPLCEGFCTPTNPSFIDPIYAYNHDGLSSAIVGGPVYQGTQFPAPYKGRLFFGDYARGFIRTMTLDASGNSTGVTDFDTSAGSVVDLKQASDGSLYYITYIPGRLYKITYNPANKKPIAAASADVTRGLEPLTVHFSSSGSSDPEGLPITFLWKFGDGTTSTAANPTKIYPNKGVYTVDLAVSDGVNTSQAVPIVIQVGTPPTVTIGMPADGAKYNAGDTISYSISGLDGAGFDLNDANLSMEIVLHHDTHIHPFYGPQSGRTGQFTVPTTGEASPNTWLELTATGTDANGLYATTSISLYPNKVSLLFTTEPAGLTFYLDGSPTLSPYTTAAVTGFQRDLSVPPLQLLNGTVYQFDHWSDNGSIKHTITTPATNTTYTAVFVPSTSFKGEYFNNLTMSGTAALTRNDNLVDFNWGEGSPDPKVNADNFSVRWTKKQTFAAGRYRFNIGGDDGYRLYIDGIKVIDRWIDQSYANWEAVGDIPAGDHDIRVEYYDSGWDAAVTFLFEPTTNPTTFTLPGVTSTPTPTPTPTSGTYLAQFWNVPGTGAAPAIPTTTPALSRNDLAINFNWGLGSPGTGVDADHFVARWTQTVSLPAGTYHFSVTADDGVRVYVDDQAIIDKWVDQSQTTYTVDQLVSAGSHVVKVEYYENGWDAVMQFGYAKVTTTPTPTPTPAAVNGLTGTYFNNKDLTSQVLSRVDPTINFDWGLGAPAPAVGAETFSVRWTGFVQPQFSQQYTFYVASDDGARLWVNNQQIINKWIDQSATEWSGRIALTAGQKYAIRLEFYDNTEDASAKLSWSSLSQPKQIIPTSRLFPN